MPFRVLNGLHAQINVQVRPIRMPRSHHLYPEYGGNRRGPEPQEVIKRQKNLLFPEKDSKAVFGDVRDLHVPNGRAGRS